jgi:hypothetical protein
MHYGALGALVPAAAGAAGVLVAGALGSGVLGAAVLGTGVLGAGVLVAGTFVAGATGRLASTGVLAGALEVGTLTDVEGRFKTW